MLILTPFIFTPVTLHHTHICLLDRFFLFFPVACVNVEQQNPAVSKYDFQSFPM